MRHTFKAALRRAQLLIVGISFIGATSAWAQETSSSRPANELSTEITNPVTSLQFTNIELETGNTPLRGELGRDLYFQPVLRRLPVQIQIAGQYFVERPTGGPEWNIQLQITPVIPRLISETLFH